jgi:3-phenylpropionate/trans-cinnamate dioxygenase ferredoxin reductase component
MMSGVVIIGAGECGVRAAFALREHGYKGEVTLIGAEAALPYERPPLSKAGEIKLIRTAETYSDNQIALRLGEVVTNIDLGNRRVSLSNGGGLRTPAFRCGRSCPTVSRHGRLPDLAHRP